MSESTDQAARRYQRIIGGAIGAIIAGLVIVVLGIGFEWGGVGGGLAIGAGAGLAGVGAYFWGYANGLRRPIPRGTWLPSRDARG